MDTSKIADALIQEAQSFLQSNQPYESTGQEIPIKMTVVPNDLKTVMTRSNSTSSGQINGSAVAAYYGKIKVRFWRRWIIWNQQRRAEQDPGAK